MCLFKNCGLGFCPGCGLGHSVGFIARGEITNSFNSHPLGILAVVILTYRIFQIFRNNQFKNKLK
ncbi:MULTISPECIES: DUF2752 domain-containing protein [unclassified Saccharicrinis]|uniref:DUF2752 domain-containing protein n=1 Tax=unclassified Saccharicrinis TaxID=2646859 RepID=UPI003D325E19